MISQDHLFEKHNISQDDFEASAVEWKDLEAIYDDYVPRRDELTGNGEGVARILSGFGHVHSLRMRIKDPEHLLAKIIRKGKENPERKITKDNYLAEITDLIGVRALHLFKEDWVSIHGSILTAWECHEAKAFVRDDSEADDFKAQGCEITKHPRAYRSVHYLIPVQITKLKCIAEIQVRTIFEEAWSEIDHLVCYPDNANDQILNGYLAIFNRLAGMANEMGSFLNLLKSEMANRDSLYRAALSDLEKYKNASEADASEKARLQKIIDQFQTSIPLAIPMIDYSAILKMFAGVGSSSLLASLPAPTVLKLADLDKVKLPKTRVTPRRRIPCKGCGRTFGSLLLSEGFCARCKAKKE